MNIFVTDPSPYKSAMVLPDKHIVKMPLETCQMLAIVCSDKWGHGYGELHKADGTPYKTEKGAFRNHPCTVWANESIINAWWLVAHGIALCEEYTHRYGKVHKSEYIIRSLEIPNLPDIGLTDFAQSMPEQYRCANDPVKAYRTYYIRGKTYMNKGLGPLWKKDPTRKPIWFC